MQKAPIRPKPSQGLRNAVTAAKRAKVLRRNKREGSALIGFFCAIAATRFEGDAVALLLDQAKTAATERPGIVSALFAESDNVDNSPVMVYTGQRAAHAAFGIFDPKGTIFPSYAKWLKECKRLQAVEKILYAAIED